MIARLFNWPEIVLTWLQLQLDKTIPAIRQASPHSIPSVVVLEGEVCWRREDRFAEVGIYRLRRHRNKKHQAKHKPVVMPDAFSFAQASTNYAHIANTKVNEILICAVTVTCVWTCVYTRFWVCQKSQASRVRTWKRTYTHAHRMKVQHKFRWPDRVSLNQCPHEDNRRT